MIIPVKFHRKIKNSDRMKVKHKVPVPKKCRYCSSKVVLTSHAHIYGKNYSEWPYLYACVSLKCGALVGLHRGTEIPLGALADQDLRQSRLRAKKSFNRMRKRLGMSKSRGYKSLCFVMQIPIEQCHFGMFDKARCEKAFKAIAAIRSAF